MKGKGNASKVYNAFPRPTAMYQNAYGLVPALSVADCVARCCADSNCGSITYNNSAVANGRSDQRGNPRSGRAQGVCPRALTHKPFAVTLQKPR